MKLDWKKSIRYALITTQILIGLGVLAQIAVTFTARWHWRLDLLSHFALQAWIGSLIAFTLAVGVRYYRCALIWGLACGWLSALVWWPVYGSNPVSPNFDSSERLRIGVVNVMIYNPHLDQLANWLDQEDFDIVGFCEYTPDCQNQLAKIRERYPYKSEFAPGSILGLAIWSKRAFLKPSVLVRPTPKSWPCMRATVSFNNKAMDFFMVHATMPLGRGRNPDPNQRLGGPEFHELGQLVRLSGSPSCVMAGDFNLTSYSPFFQDLLAVSGLRDSRVGFGQQTSWPSHHILGFRICIDHALISPDLAVIDRRLGPRFGSDHLPIILELVPARSSSWTNESIQAAQSSFPF